MVAARKVLAAGVLLLLATACGGTEPEDPPAPTPSETQEDSPAALIAECLRDKGWEVKVHPDNSYSVGGIPQEQVAQFEADDQTCQEAGDHEPPPPMTQEQAGAYYEALWEVAECVRGQGYDPGEAPSRQAAVEALMAPIIDLRGWPYGDLQGIESAQELDELYAACPQPTRPS